MQDEAALMRAVARRDPRAFERLYRGYARRLARFLSRMLTQREAVDEVINDVMLAVWQNADRFDAAVGPLSTWLFGIAHHKALKARSRLPAQPGRPLPCDDARADAEPIDAQHGADTQSPELILLRRERAQALVRAVAQLSAEQRTVLELAFGDGRSYHEIAALTGCSENTVKTRVFHARRRLAAARERNMWQI